jgi:hypothetical protein
MRARRQDLRELARAGFYIGAILVSLFGYALLA